MAKRKATTKKTTKKITKKVNISKSLSNKIEKALLCLTNPRVREVIERRFGLGDGQPETLESIGKSHGITRERVRQIQDVGLNILRSDEVLSLFGSVFNQLDQLFADHGHLIGEEYLYSMITNTDKPHPLRGQLYLILTLGEPYQKVVNDSRFHPFWASSPSARDRAEKIVDSLISYFEKQNQVINKLDVLNAFSKKYSGEPVDLFHVVLDIAREIDMNSFEEFGLVHWPEITPQGVKDRAYLVLKRTGEPLHFTRIAELINEMGLSSKTAYPQTVHNELIKEPKFVLVGRGTYGLTDWGYESGTVADVIQTILKKSKKPMTKKQVLDAVLSQRRVKPTTIALNLQRLPGIVKVGGDKYTLKS